MVRIVSTDQPLHRSCARDSVLILSLMDLEDLWMLKYLYIFFQNYGSAVHHNLREQLKYPIFSKFDDFTLAVTAQRFFKELF